MFSDVIIHPLFPIVQISTFNFQLLIVKFLSHFTFAGLICGSPLKAWHGPLRCNSFDPLLLPLDPAHGVPGLPLWFLSIHRDRSCCHCPISLPVWRMQNVTPCHLPPLFVGLKREVETGVGTKVSQATNLGEVSKREERMDHCSSCA